MSAYLNGDEEGLDPRVKVKSSEIINPSPDRVFVFIEEHETSAWAGSFKILPRETFSLSSLMVSSVPSDRHDQGCNVSFVDGHVDYWKWHAPKEAGSQTKLTANFQELRDLRRLQQAVPRPY
jgi:prepilin-type processing-associated H-X9-DG protein